MSKCSILKQILLRGVVIENLFMEWVLQLGIADYRRVSKYVITSLLMFIVTACGGNQLAQHALKTDSNLESRIQNILANLTLEQKVGQMVMAEIKHTVPADMAKWGLGAVLNGGGSFPNNNRHAQPEDWLQLADAYYQESIKKTKRSAGIPVIWGTDAVHGHNNVVGATIFPHNIGLGAAGDPELVKRIAQATAREVAATGIDWVFAPMVAVAIDDRWGRTYESYSDRPARVSEYARNFVVGLQGAGNTLLSDEYVIATAKHFIGDGSTGRGDDQGDSHLQESTLLKLHGQGYVAVIAAGVQTIMVSLNSWHGEKIHGHKHLLTNILRDQFGFDGILLSDWNGIGQVEGCTNQSCAKAINAGIDMIMVTEDWRLFISNTLAQVRSGQISEARINEAVSRILRVKLRAGVFDREAPSSKVLAGQYELLGHEDHRKLAREAVRKSLVLLKNNNKTLPIAPNSHILLAGSGANNIGMQSGGWTVSWQGRDSTKTDFPGASSIYDGVSAAVQAAGGEVTLSELGDYDEKPDVAIVVIGEQPYAEGEGDSESLEHQAGRKTDLKLLKKLSDDGIPVVTVLLSGRPLWVNAELNASDAFVAAWLPGSEGIGIADLLLASPNTDIEYDFSGRLSFDWPGIDVNRNDHALPVKENLFTYGYGLSYKSDELLDSSLNEVAANTVFDFDIVVFRGGSKKPWSAYLGDASNWNTRAQGNSARSALGEIEFGAVDRKIQEDSLRLSWSGNGDRVSQFYWQTERPVDISQLRDEGGALIMMLRIDQKPKGRVIQRMDCGYPCRGELDITGIYRELLVGTWQKIGIPLACFEQAGADLSKINSPFLLQTDQSFGLTIHDVFIAKGMPSAELIACTKLLHTELN